MISFKRKLINFRCKIQLDHLVGSAQLYLKDRPRPPSTATAMHITTNRLHSAAARRNRRLRQFRLGPPIERSGISKRSGGGGVFYGRFLSLFRLLRCVRRTMAAHFADCSLRFSPPSLLVYQSASAPWSFRPSQMKSVDQMAADAVCCTEVRSDAGSAVV